MIEALIGFAAFLVLAFLRVPMAFAMGIVGFAGVAYKLNFNVASAMLGQVPYDTALTYALSVLPLFMLMGNLVAHRGCRGASAPSKAFLGHYRGGLAMATIVACGGFGGCAALDGHRGDDGQGRVPLDAQIRYKDALAAGRSPPAARRHPHSAGGDHGDLRHMTETDIGKLYIAGIVPGCSASWSSSSR